MAEVPEGMCRCCWLNDNMGERAVSGTPYCSECWETCVPESGAS